MAQCPKKNMTANNNALTKRQQEIYDKMDAALKVAPKSGEAHTKTINGVTYKWCGKCFRNRGAWSKTHSTAEHTSDYYKNNKKGLLAGVEAVNVDPLDCPEVGMFMSIKGRGGLDG